MKLAAILIISVALVAFVGSATLLDMAARRLIRPAAPRSWLAEVLQRWSPSS